MKKIISLVLAFMMSLNICMIAGAESILTGTYTFIDSAYSPELDMYVVMAKDFSSSSHNTQLYSSTDGVKWTSCLPSAVGGINYATKYTSQLLVWWEKEDMFVAMVGSKAYVSNDGINWSVNANLNCSNGMIETNGDTLVMVGDKTLRIAKDADSEPMAFVVGSGSRYFKGVGIYPDEDKYFALDGSAWGGYTSTVSGTEIVVNEKFNNNKFYEPLDVLYVPQISGWITVNNSRTEFAVITDDIVNVGNSISYKTPKLSGGDNIEKLTGIGVGEEYVVLGTQNGKIYWKSADDVSDNNILWEELDVNSENEIKGITKSRDGFLLGISTKEIFILKETDEGVKLVDTEECIIESKVKRIEAPQNGTQDIFSDGIEMNYFNQNVTGLITEIAPAEGNEDVGASWSGEKFVFTVPDSADGERKFNVTDIYGRNHELIVNFVKELGVGLDGFDIIALPEEGEADVEIQYTPYILASDGEKMQRPAKIEMVSGPKGITFDAERNVIVASSDGESGTLVLKVISEGLTENTDEFGIAVTKRMPETIEVSTDKESVLIPEEGEVFVESTATVYDQIKTEMKNESVLWSLEGKTDGITVDKNTGKVSVSDKAYSGELNIVATSLKDNAVIGKKTIILNWTDRRSVKEALTTFDDNTVTGENLLFEAVNKDGVTLTWESSDENVITDEGIVKPDRKKDIYATVKMTARKNDEYGEKTFKVTVLKEDNIAKIGDFEDGNIDGINGELTEESYEGKYALKTKSKLEFDVDVEKGSIYVFEAYVKADGKVSISTENGGKIAEISCDDKYERIVGSYLYSRNDLTDKVTISAPGEWSVDEIKVYEITLEYEEVIELVAKAEYSKKKADIEAAKNAVSSFLDIPLKSELEKRVDKIKPASTGGGGSSGGGGGYITPQSTSAGTVGITGETINNDEKVYEHLLVFKDLSKHWAKDDVEYMANLGIVSGVSETEFNPDANITRAEFAKLIVKAVGMEEVSYENTYYDVVTEDWYSGYVQAAKEAGYISGYNGMFRPNDKITREEMAKVIASAFIEKSGKKLEQGGALYFNDIENISGWAYDYIVLSTREGFINGVTDELFAPKSNATRAQAVVMLKRLHDKLNAE